MTSRAVVVRARLPYCAASGGWPAVDMRMPRNRSAVTNLFALPPKSCTPAMFWSDPTMEAWTGDALRFVMCQKKTATGKPESASFVGMNGLKASSEISSGTFESLSSSLANG